MVWRFIPLVFIAFVSLPQTAAAQQSTVVRGIVPAPAGTAIRLEVLDLVKITGVVCATSTTTPI